MFLLRTLVLAVTAGLLAGCAVGPDYHRPDAPLLKQYHSQPAVQQRSASRIASFDVWWEGFNDPMLSSLVSDALAQNRDLAQATARMAQARADRLCGDAGRPASPETGYYRGGASSRRLSCT
ncbi:hypothetical protein BI322_19825 [Klebsiella oxytoca]|nr:hypothetical protein BI322_19825 [Klebsiella oxytoca]